MTGTAPAEAEPHALVELHDHTLVVTMNRPEARNALSAEMLAIMEQAWDRANEDPEVRVVILTGAGGYFCAGADLKAMSSSAPSEKFESGQFDPSRIKSLLKGYRVTKPLIAAVANAIYDATGVRLRRVPFRPARVLAALKAAGV